MKNLIKNILSQGFINIFYHLPKAVLANIIYGFPARGMKVIGITGTDGKTTTTNMIYQILKAAGKKVSMVSTINAPGFHVTSPDPFLVQKFAKQAKENNDEYLVLEVTSHALDQYRFWGIKFEVGVITNITHEHLDYHKTFAKYQMTKFQLIKNVRFAIINQNLKQYVVRSHKLLLSHGQIITFGLSEGDFNRRQIKLRLKTPGDYNIENALASMAVAFALGIDKVVVRKALENFPGISGRMEEIENSKGLQIFIDFAHTPNALEQVLKTLKAQSKGRLIAIFGSAGKRDVGKRDLMGQAAGKLADIVIITAEDPRGELDVINQRITNGAEKAGLVMRKNLFVIEDREKAINFAINKIAKKGDTIGIFGKGHETSMNLDGRKEIPWLDKDAVKRVLDG